MTDILARSFARDLRARNRRPRTIQTYLEALSLLGETCDPERATADDIRGFIEKQLAQHSPGTAANRFRSLQQFYRWAHHEGIVPENPMLGMRPPAMLEQPVPVLSLEQVKALLRACDGKGFEQRRDTAIVRLFLEPGGLRLSELVGLHIKDLDLDLDEVIVTGKGGRQRVVPFGVKTGQALERYARDRAGHPHAKETTLWLGSKGPLTNSGCQQMLRRRAAQAGIPHLHPHMLRHTAAHEWMASGGQETDAMRLFGWRSRSMLGRYGASAADERAKAASRRMSLGDRY